MATEARSSSGCSGWSTGVRRTAADSVHGAPAEATPPTAYASSASALISTVSAPASRGTRGTAYQAGGVTAATSDHPRVTPIAMTVTWVGVPSRPGSTRANVTVLATSAAHP